MDGFVIRNPSGGRGYTPAPLHPLRPAVAAPKSWEEVYRVQVVDLGGGGDCGHFVILNKIKEKNSRRYKDHTVQMIRGEMRAHQLLDENVSKYNDFFGIPRNKDGSVNAVKYTAKVEHMAKMGTYIDQTQWIAALQLYGDDLPPLICVKPVREFGVTKLVQVFVVFKSDCPVTDALSKASITQKSLHALPSDITLMLYSNSNHFQRLDRLSFQAVPLPTPTAAPNAGEESEENGDDNDDNVEDEEEGAMSLEESDLDDDDVDEDDEEEDDESLKAEDESDNDVPNLASLVPSTKKLSTKVQSTGSGVVPPVKAPLPLAVIGKGVSHGVAPTLKGKTPAAKAALRNKGTAVNAFEALFTGAKRKAEAVAAKDDDGLPVSKQPKISVRKPLSVAAQVKLDAIPVLVAPRHTYTPVEEQAIMEFYLANDQNAQFTRDEVIKKGYTTFSRTVLQRWKKTARWKPACAQLVDGMESRDLSGLAYAEKTPRGRKINNKFEASVFARLVWVTVTKAKTDADASTVNRLTPDDRRNPVKFAAAQRQQKESFAELSENIIHSYEVIRMAAGDTQASAEWASDAGVQKLKFSNKWIQLLLKRYNLSRQKITTTSKADRPSPEDVQATMVVIQKFLMDEGFELCDIINFDETPTVWGLNPDHKWMPTASGGRAAAPAGDNRSRFTTNCVFSAEGLALPVSFIIKCSTGNDDQSAVRVLKTLLADKEFNTDGLWELKNWSRVMEVKRKTKITKVEFTRQYLVHPDGRVVWAQKKAYQDTPGLAMLCDLVLGPLRVKSGRERWAMIWDNCAAHDVPSVLAVFEEWGIKPMSLPKYMTDILQPVDVVANAPLKKHTCRGRVFYIYNDFQDWRIEATDAVLGGRPIPPFLPAPPTMASGLSLISRIFAERFTQQDFQDSMARCFRTVGLAPTNSVGNYVRYMSHKHGLSKAKGFGGVALDQLSGGSLICDVDFFFEDEAEQIEDGQDDEADGQVYEYDCSEGEGEDSRADS